MGRWRHPATAWVPPLMCARKNSGAPTKQVTPAPPPPEDPEGTELASFGGILKFPDWSQINREEAPEQCPLPSSCLGSARL